MKELEISSATALEEPYEYIELFERIMKYGRILSIVSIVSFLTCFAFIFSGQFEFLCLMGFPVIGFLAGYNFNKHMTVVYLVYLILLNFIRVILFFIMENVIAIAVNAILMIIELMVVVVICKFYYLLDGMKTEQNIKFRRWLKENSINFQLFNTA